MAALSEQLIQVHQSLRQQLAVLRREAADGADLGAAGLNDLHRDLRSDLHSHCIGFCTAIRTHHTGEDNQLLPTLRAAPELAPVIDNLLEDHGLIAGILQRIGELLAPGQPPSGPDTLIRELDGLTAILESHFGYEERRIAKALDTLTPDAWTPDVFVITLAAPDRPGRGAPRQPPGPAEATAIRNRTDGAPRRAGNSPNDEMFPDARR